MNELVQEFLGRQGLNWTVESQRMQLPSGKQTPFFANVRMDKETPLGQTAEGYEVFQNYELYDIADRISQHSGFSIHSGQCFGNGERVLIRMKGKDKILEYKKIGDVVERWMYLTNTFDKTSGLSVKSYLKTLTCLNGQTTTVTQRLASVRHSSRMREVLDAALYDADLITQKQENMFSKIEEMILANMKPDSDDTVKAVERMTKIATGIDVTEVPEGGFSTRSLNIVEDFLRSVSQETDEKGFNIWGLLSGVTHYTTHKKGGDKNRAVNKVFGEAARADQKAFEYAEKLIPVFA